MRSAEKKKIAVIGAGAAGLSAARRLGELGLSCAVFEARDRIGGRVFTDHGFASIPIEHGAEFIHERSVEIDRLLKETRAELVAVEQSSERYHLNGVWRPYPELERSPVLEPGLKAPFEGLCGFSESRPDAPVLEAVREMKLHPDAERLALFQFEALNLAPPARLSAKAVAREQRNAEGEFHTDRVRLGYAALMEQLASGTEITLGSSATRVLRGATGITLETRSVAQGNSQRAEFDGVIVTIPLPLAQEGAIRFEPPLPSAFTNALMSLGSGAVTKAYFVFKERFWDERVGLFLRAPPVTGWWSPGYLRDDAAEHVFSAYLTGEASEKIDALPTEQRIEFLLENLEKYFDAGGLRSMMVNFRLHSWNLDPWSKGSYSFVPLGAADAKKALCNPIDGRVVFAGEWVTPDSMGGTVHAALCSGRQAAEKLAAAFS